MSSRKFETGAGALEAGNMEIDYSKFKNNTNYDDFFNKAAAGGATQASY